VQVIDVASAAKRAADQSTDADRRCDELSRLAQRAGEHAAAVRRLAASLTETAAAAARLAVDVCRYDSYRHGYEAAATTAHRAAIDVDTFLSLVETQRGGGGGGGRALRTSSEDDELATASDGHSDDVAQSGHHDQSTSTDDDDVAAPLSAAGGGASQHDDCASASLHAVSVPAIGVVHS